MVAHVHYRLSFTLKVDGRERTAETVVDVKYWSIPNWQRYVPPMGFYGSGGGLIAVGHAAAMRVGDGAVCMLYDSYNYQRFGYLHTASALADKLLSSAIPAGMKPPAAPFIWAQNARFVRGRAEIPVDLLPTMIVFEDADNPHTARLFDAATPERWLRSAVVFVGAHIEVTSDEVGSDIATVLPWLASAPINLTTVRDPFAVETQGRRFLAKTELF